MMSSCRLDVVALSTLTIPEAFKVVHRLSFVLHESLHILLETLESVIFNFLGGITVVVDSYFSSFTVLPVFDFLANLFVQFEILGSTRF